VTEPHGKLPPWGVAALPEAPPFTLRNVLRTIGPGVIGLGVAIGGGEWLLGPAVVVTQGPGLLWLVVVAVLLQANLNLEMGRYTLYTGEPVMIGFMRTWPGPGFWGWAYAALSFLQLGWPAIALSAATAAAALLLGRMPTGEDSGLVIALGYVTFAACFGVISVGKKVERTVELAMRFMMVWVFSFLFLVDVTTVAGANWARIFQGLVSFGNIPAGSDWNLLAAFAAYSGLGGVANAFITNWMRDKGYAMGATVGYIPSAFAPGGRLSATGNVFVPTKQSLPAWRRWWAFFSVDQWAVFALGSIGGMILTTVMALQYVPPDTQVGGWTVVNVQAQGLAAAHGPIFWFLTLIAGFWVLFSTQLGFVDGIPRSITDMLWTGSSVVRRWRGGDVRAVYYSVLILYITWGCISLHLAQPLTLLILAANIGGANFVLLSLHTLVVNRRFLPRELRPPPWREAALLLCTLFYGTFAVVSLRAVWS
jgi:hypothetical protein